MHPLHVVAPLVDAQVHAAAHHVLAQVHAAAPPCNPQNLFVASLSFSLAHVSFVLVLESSLTA